MQLPEIQKKLLQNIIFNKIDNYAYFEDVCRAYAVAIVKKNDHMPFDAESIPDFSETSRTPPQILSLIHISEPTRPR